MTEDSDEHGWEKLANWTADLWYIQGHVVEMTLDAYFNYRFFHQRSVCASRAGLRKLIFDERICTAYGPS